VEISRYLVRVFYDYSSPTRASLGLGTYALRPQRDIAHGERASCKLLARAPVAKLHKPSGSRACQPVSAAAYLGEPNRPQEPTGRPAADSGRQAKGQPQRRRAAAPPPATKKRRRGARARLTVPRGFTRPASKPSKNTARPAAREERADDGPPPDARTTRIQRRCRQRNR
jgi:hypothetical protein